MEEITNSQLKCELFAHLYENSVCVRCILRCLKLSVFSVYQNRSAFPELLDTVGTKTIGRSLRDAFGYETSSLIRSSAKLEEEVIVTEEKPKEGEVINTTKAEAKKEEELNLCGICLGVLQNVDLPENVDSVCAKIREADFEFKAFKFFIKVPLGTQIRFANYLCHAEVVLAEKIAALPADQKQLFALNILNWRDNFIDIKTVYKWILPDLLSEKFGIPATSSVECPFVLAFTISADEDDAKQFGVFAATLDNMCSYEEKKKKKKFKDNSQAGIVLSTIDPTQGNLEKISKLPRSQFYALRKETLPTRPTQPAKIEITASYNSTFVMGNYCKYSRYMSQSPWVIDGVSLSETSIQEEIAGQLIPHLKCSGYKFSTGGREDIDVRMLGTGRPFVFEVYDCRRVISLTNEDLARIERTLNTTKTECSVNSLRFADVRCFDELKKSEQEKIKSYACIVQTLDVIRDEQIEMLNGVTELVVQQKTPIRVLHRRSQMIRTKIIHKLKAFKLSDRYMVLYVLSSAGTYIKEFVHGDLERTTPNIGSLLNTEADIFQLDVFKLYPNISPESLEDFEKVCTPPKSIVEWM